MRYRLYRIDTRDDHIRSGKDVPTDNDEEAIRLGWEAHPDGAFEVWHGGRRVYPGATR